MALNQLLALEQELQEVHEYQMAHGRFVVASLWALEERGVLMTQNHLVSAFVLELEEHVKWMVLHRLV